MSLINSCVILFIWYKFQKYFYIIYIFKLFLIKFQKIISYNFRKFTNIKL